MDAYEQTQKGGIGFEEAQEIFSHPYYLDLRSVNSTGRSVGWVISCMPLSSNCGRTTKASTTTS
jgi:hypothetical protein